VEEKEADNRIKEKVKIARKMIKTDSYKTEQQLINELVKLGRGIVEWETSEAGNKEIRDQLGRLEKRATIEQLARGIGHELRNSLGAIKNAAYFLNMALEEPQPEVKEALNILDKNVTRAEEVIRGLIVFNHARLLTLLKADINDIGQNALSRTSMPKNIERDRNPGRDT